MITIRGFHWPRPATGGTLVEMSTPPPHARVLFLPGAGGDGAFWHPLGARLPAEWPKTFLDWPGLGAVAPSPDVGRFDDLVRLVLQEIDGPVDLVAQSMGGVVALRVACVHPALVRRLVLVATSGGVDTGRFGAADWRQEYVREYPPAQRWIVEERPDLTADLPSVESPALLVWGDADAISPLGIGRYLASVLPCARLVVVAGGDHALGRDRAAEIAPAVRRHLA
jgi:pimeloyl-ACP methyl ester carboxylesterase